MNAKCPNCGTAYEIPGKIISEKGLPTKCAKCGTIFRVFPSVPLPEPDEQQDREHPSQPQEEKKPAPKRNGLQTVAEFLASMEPEAPTAPQEPEPDALPDSESLSEFLDSGAEEPEPREDDAALQHQDTSPSESEKSEDFPSSDQGPATDSELDALLEDDDFRMVNQPSVRFAAALVLIAALTALCFFIVEISKSVEATYEQTFDRDSYADALALKKSFSPERVYERAVTLLHRGASDDIQHAGELFTDLLARDPKNATYRARLAEAQIFEGLRSADKEETGLAGCKTTSELIAEEDVTADAKRAHSACLFFKKQMPQAIQFANEAIELQENDPLKDGEAWLLIGQVEIQRNQKNEALEALEKASALNPNLFFSHFLSADIYYGKVDYEKAADEAKKAVTINPDHEAAKKNLALYRAKWEELSKLMGEGGTFEAHYEAAQKLYAQGRYNEGITQLNKALALNGRSVAALLTKTRWLIDSNPSTALQAAREAAGAGSLEAYYWMGAIQQNMGNTVGAMTSYDAYLRGAPNGSHAYEVENILKHLKGE